MNAASWGRVGTRPQLDDARGVGQGSCLRDLLVGISAAASRILPAMRRCLRRMASACSRCSSLARVRPLLWVTGVRPALPFFRPTTLPLERKPAVRKLCVLIVEHIVYKVK